MGFVWKPFLALAVAGVAAMLFFVAPTYHRRYESKMIDFSHERYYSPATVSREFAEHGVKLQSRPGIAGIVLFSTVGSRWDADALQIAVARPTGNGSWGPQLEPYDERFGNVLVTYGGHDERLLARVRATLSTLRKDS